METVFAESPDRVLAIQLGELPALQRPETKPYPDIGPSISWPLNGVPWRYASQGGYASPPGGGGPGQDPDDPKVQYKGRPGIDSRFEHLVLAFNRAGDIVESGKHGAIVECPAWTTPDTPTSRSAGPSPASSKS